MITKLSCLTNKGCRVGFSIEAVFSIKAVIRATWL
jgi:hypothetical protein